MARRASATTVVVAFSANAGIAAAKLVAGFLSGSSAMLAEAAHSVADTINEVFLYTSVRLSGRPRDRAHPFGYGKEQYFWVLIAAVGIFVGGGLFSVLRGTYALLNPGLSEGSALVPYIVLAVAALLDGTSWLRAVWQARREAPDSTDSLPAYVANRADPTLKTVAFEDTAALLGLALAGLGIGLHQLTGQRVYDSAAAIAIGLLLFAVAYRIGRDAKALLIGQAAPPDINREIEDELTAVDGISSVVELRTMQLSSESVLVAAAVRLQRRLTSEEIEKVADTADRHLHQRFPWVTDIFLDPTGRHEQHPR